MTTRTEETGVIEVGRFTFDCETKSLRGPAAYMADGGPDRVLARIAAGTCSSFTHNPYRESHPIRSALVSIQTDYAGWIGLRTLGIDGRS